MADQELDLRPVRLPDRHPTVFRAYDALPVGGSVVVVTEHDPADLRVAFDVEHPDSYGWEPLGQGPDAWRLRITKRSSTPLPRAMRCCPIRSGLRLADC